MDEVIRLTGARVALAASRTARIELTIRRGRFLPFDTAVKAAREYDLSGHLLLPGLINAHDHLEFSLFPRLGEGPWANSREWAAGIYRPDDSPVKEHRSIPRAVRLMWGAVRNLLCGVTTVAHHNPFEQLFTRRDFPVRVVRKSGWAHSLDFCPDLAERRLQTPRGWPFVLHAAEGTDESARLELTRLVEIGLVDDHTVLVHATGATSQQLKSVRARGASIVWCPSSNLFTLGATLPAATVRGFPATSLGTDSGLTAEGDLIDEIRVARQHSGLTASEIYPLVTSNPARALRLTAGEGTIREGGIADLVAVQDTGQTPAEALARLTPELVLIGGRTSLVSPRLERAFTFQEMHRVNLEGRGRWLVRAPIPMLHAAASAVLGPGVRLAGKRVSP